MPFYPPFSLFVNPFVMNVNNFITQRPYLIWHTKNFEHLSDEAALDAVLNYGDFDDVKKFVAPLGQKKQRVFFAGSCGIAG